MSLFNVDDQKGAGELIRKMRLDAGISQQELATRCQRSLSTIKNAEAGRNLSRDTIAAVEKALGADVLRSEAMDLGQSWVLHVLDEYLSCEWTEALKRRFSKQTIIINYPEFNYSTIASNIRQSHFNSPVYIKSLHRLRAAAIKVTNLATQMEGRAFDVISLTCGHGWIEYDLLDHISAKNDGYHRLFLVHPCINLLLHGMKALSSRVRDANRYRVFPIVADYMSIKKFSVLNQRKPTDRCRMLCLFSIFINEDNDRAILESVTAMLLSGDYLLIDINLPQWDYADMKSILRSDPRLNGELSRSIKNGAESYMEQLILEYCNSVSCIEWTYRLRQHHEIGENQTSLRRNSLSEYCVEAVANIHLFNGATNTVSGMRFNRHHPSALVKNLHALGWDLINQSVTERETDEPAAAACLLFRKR